jgi:hypothetical protein
MTTTAYGKTFEPPRPGAWEIDLTHFPRPTTKFVQEVFGANFGRGFAEGTKLYGLLLDRMDHAVLHGFTHNAMRPVGAPDDAKGPATEVIKDGQRVRVDGGSGEVRVLRT